MLHRFIQYNTWANQQICEYILKSSNTADQTVISSFPSIRKTLYHIWDAQEIWLFRLKRQAITDFPSKSFTGTLEEGCEGITASSSEMEKIAHGMAMDTQINYQDLKGNLYTSTAEEILMHVVNHGTYHRGQIITLLRQCGFTEVGSTDFMRFLRK